MGLRRDPGTLQVFQGPVSKEFSGTFPDVSGIPLGVLG